MELLKIVSSYDTKGEILVALAEIVEIDHKPPDIRKTCGPCEQSLEWAEMEDEGWAF